MSNTIDLAKDSVRTLNQTLHDLPEGTDKKDWSVENPRGSHAIACGLDREIDVTIKGHVGYYCAGMNQKANVTVHGNCGVGIAENIMSGTVRVKGNASQSAGATGHGGMVVIEGDASARCGISMKGVDIVVQGSVGHLSAFMAQSGNLVVCGDAGEALGDSLYETRIFVAGKAENLGADCVEKEMRDEHKEILEGLLSRSGVNADVNNFRRYGSARKLYNFNIDNVSEY